ncbi:MAG: hypothetical protein ABIH68_00155 [bacterium]
MKRFFAFGFVVLFVCGSAFGQSLKLGLGLNYFSADERYNENGDVKSYGDTYTEMRVPLSISYLPTDKLTIGILVPVVSRSYDYVDPLDIDASGSGIGDIEIGGSYKLLEETDSSPVLSCSLSLILPTGKNYLQDNLADDESALGGPMFGSGFFYTGNNSVDIGINVSKNVFPVVLTANFGYLMTMETKAKEWGDYKYNWGDSIKYGISAEYPLENISPSITIEGVSTGKYEVEGIEEPDSETSILRIIPGIKAEIAENTNLKAGIAIPVSGKNEFKGITISVGFSYMLNLL